MNYFLAFSRSHQQTLQLSKCLRSDGPIILDIGYACKCKVSKAFIFVNHLTLSCFTNSSRPQVSKLREVLDTVKKKLGRHMANEIQCEKMYDKAIDKHDWTGKKGKWEEGEDLTSVY